jgi:hypothetical protein
LPARPKPKPKPKPTPKAKAKATKPKPKPKKKKPGRVLGDALQLDNEKLLLKQYYGGQRMESPNGGFLMLLGVRPAEGGSSIGIFECSASSLRYELEIPKPTRTEKAKVKAATDAGEDPDCPRHGQGLRLVRTGKDLVCIACGIAYGKVQ